MQLKLQSIHLLWNLLFELHTYLKNPSMKYFNILRTNEKSYEMSSSYGVNSTSIRMVSTFRPSSRIAFLPSSDCSNFRNFATSGISAIRPVELGFLESRKVRHSIPSFP